MTRLQLERINRGLTQLTLGFYAGIQPSEISRYERGRLRPSPAQLSRLARALGITEPDVLLEDVAEQNQPEKQLA